MTVLYSFLFDQPLPGCVFNEKLQLLSPQAVATIKKYRRWEDSHASLYGKLLLQKGFKAFDLSAKLADVKLNNYGKPYLEKRPVSFNISHSAHCVVCVLSTDTSTIGVDVEKICDVDVHEFRNVWNEYEWRQIETGSPDMFYKFWTRKEAIVKAEGKGLSIPLTMVDVQESHGTYGDKTYFFSEFRPLDRYIVSLAAFNVLQPIEYSRLLLPDVLDITI